jgi:transposase
MVTSSTTLTMAEQLVPDEVWTAIQPLLPAKRPHPRGGRPWIADRAVLGGIVYVLRAGVPWRLLPAQELGCGSGVTCWRRLRDWQQAGVWEQLHHRLLDWLGDDGQVVLLLDALVGLAILRGRWRQALALGHAQPAPGPTP